MSVIASASNSPKPVILSVSEESPGEAGPRQRTPVLATPDPTASDALRAEILRLSLRCASE